jgi:hypothetical protein
MSLSHLVGKEVAVRSLRIPHGKIVRLEKDRWGIFWSESFQKARVENEESLKVYKLSRIKVNL